MPHRTEPSLGSRNSSQQPGAMNRINRDDVERIAAEYAKSIGLAPFIVEGSSLVDEEGKATWNVFLSFCESPDGEENLFDSIVIHVDDITGIASHIEQL